MADATKLCEPRVDLLLKSLPASVASHQSASPNPAGLSGALRNDPQKKFVKREMGHVRS
jgi:hypothetical protein